MPLPHGSPCPRRAAILLDELDGQQGLCAEGPSRAGRHIVVELKTPNALPLLKYACSRRVIALPTGQLNAQRVSHAGGCSRCSKQPIGAEAGRHTHAHTAMGSYSKCLVLSKQHMDLRWMWLLDGWVFV